MSEEQILREILYEVQRQIYWLDRIEDSLKHITHLLWILIIMVGTFILSKLRGSASTETKK